MPHPPPSSSLPKILAVSKHLPPVFGILMVRYDSYSFLEEAGYVGVIRSEFCHWNPNQRRGYRPQ